MNKQSRCYFLLSTLLLIAKAVPTLESVYNSVSYCGSDGFLTVFLTKSLINFCLMGEVMPGIK